MMINISKQIYFGWNNSFVYKDLHEAEIIPAGNTVQEKKKLEKFTKTYPDIAEFENVPLPGFTLYKSNRKYWSSDQSWLVIDPRGFLVRITAQNLENILHVSGITEGLIQQKCVWARDDSKTQMFLVPVSSKTYAEAVKNTELLDDKVSISAVEIGDTVLLQNGLSGRYMGVATLYSTLLPKTYASTEHRIQSMLRRQILEVTPSQYYHQSDLKILKIIQKADKKMTKEDAVKEMNDSISSGNAYFTNLKSMVKNHFYNRYTIKHVSANTVPKVALSLEEVTLDEATALFSAGSVDSDFGLLLVEDHNNKQFLIDHPQFGFPTFALKATVDSFAVYEITSKVEGNTNIILKERRTYNNSSVRYSLKDFKKFYKIVKHVKSETYI